jgi:arylformamidase
MIYDISYTLHEGIQVYKNLDHKKPRFETIATHQNDDYHETDIHMNLHTGTHVDFPLHMIAGGQTSDSEQIEQFVGSCKVLDMTHVSGGISKSDLMKYDIKEDDFLLFKTKNSFFDDFLFDFTYLNEEGATYLASLNIRGVGTDGLGIERAQSDHPTHKILLSNGIAIIEGLRLAAIQPGSYQLICLPLKIKGVEASLARAILVEK